MNYYSCLKFIDFCFSTPTNIRRLQSKKIHLLEKYDKRRQDGKASITFRQCKVRPYWTHHPRVVCSGNENRPLQMTQNWKVNTCARRFWNKTLPTRFIDF